ncbi:Asx homology domain-containing protein [Hypoxylon sp. FL1150]|nr:Asx homology domain-containing protein [Hypoxylon sp. FL1150]
MPRRNKSSIAGEPSDTPKRTTRSNARPFRKLATREDHIAEEITVRYKSNASSRPSTANGNAAASSSQQSGRRITPTPTKDGDVDKLDAIYGIEDSDELAISGPALKKPKPTTIKNVTASGSRKGKYKYDDPDEMLTSSNSPLATVNLRDLLCSPKAWDLLGPDEQQRVLTFFPDKEVLDKETQQVRPNIAALRNDDNFRHDVARYQDGLSKGWHDPEWIEQAQAAHQQRAAGVYDEYVAARFKEDWGVPMPPYNQDHGCLWDVPDHVSNNSSRDDSGVVDEEVDRYLASLEARLKSGSDVGGHADPEADRQPDQEDGEEQPQPEKTSEQETDEMKKGKGVEGREELDAMQGVESTGQEDIRSRWSAPSYD